MIGSLHLPGAVPHQTPQASIGAPGHLPEKHEAYFHSNVAPGARHAVVPIHELHATHARPEGIANAKKIMQKVHDSGDHSQRREPISVVPHPEGGYHVADGNSTYEAMRSSGWKHAPVQVFPSMEHAQAHEARMKEIKNSTPKTHQESLHSSPHEITNPIPKHLPTHEKVAKLEELGRENAPIISHLMKSMDETHGTHSHGGFKKTEGLIEKADRPSIKEKKPWFGAEHIRDQVRWTHEIKSFDHIHHALDAVKKHGIGVVKADHKKMFEPKVGGWRMANMDLRMPNGQLAEMQMSTPKLLAEKSGQGHKLYEKWRKYSKEQIQNDPKLRKAHARDQQKSEENYHKAFHQDMKDMGYEGKDDPNAEHDYSHALHKAGIISKNDFMATVDRLGTHSRLIPKNVAASATNLSLSSPLSSIQWLGASSTDHPGATPEDQELESWFLNASLRPSASSVENITNIVPSRSSLAAVSSSTTGRAYPNRDITVGQLRESAKIAAIKAFAEGRILLTEHGGALGVWADGPTGNWFVELALADKAFVKPSEDPNDHFAVWAHGKNKRPVQLQVDSKSGKIINADDILKDLLDMDPEEQEKALDQMDQEMQGQDQSDGPPTSVDSENYDKVAALSESGTTNLFIDLTSGHVLNWAEKKDQIEELSPSEIVELAGFRQKVTVHSYQKRSGTIVRQHEANRIKGDHAERVSWEAVPGVDSGVMAGIHRMDYQTKLEFTHDVIKSFTSNGSDELAAAVGLPQPVYEIGAGWYEGVSNPSVQADFLVERTPENLLKIEAYASVLGLALAQDSVGHHFAKVSTSNSDIKVKEYWLAKPLGPSEIGMIAAELVNAAPEFADSIYPVANKSGIRFLNGSDDLDSDLFQRVCEAVIQTCCPEDVVQKWGYSGILGLIGKEDYETNIRRVHGETDPGNAGSDREGFGGDQARGAGSSVDSSRLYNLCARIREAAERSARRLCGESSSPVNLSEGGAPPKELRPGDHWITIKPHGPDDPDYRHVIVRTMKDGSGMIVWAGEKGLTHLRLNKMGTKEQAEGAWKKKPQQLTPEQADADKARRKQRLAALDASRSKFGEALVKNLGLTGAVDPEQALAAVETGVLKRGEKVGQSQMDDDKEPGEVNEELEGAKEKEKLDQILSGDGDIKKEGGKSIDQADSPKETIARRMIADLLGEDVGDLDDDAPEALRQGWNEMRDDPQRIEDMNLLIKGYRDEQAKIKREMKGAAKGSIRVLGNIGFYAEEEGKEQTRKELEKSVQEMDGYKKRSEFHERVDSLDNAQRYYSEGLGDGISHALQSFGGSNLVLNRSTIDLFGGQVVAGAVAAHIRNLGEGAQKKALDSLEKEFVQAELPTVQEAMDTATALREERKQVAKERLAGDILSSAAGRALADLTITEKKHLARTAGSLEGMAMVLDNLRQTSPRPLHLTGLTDQTLRNFERAGMVQGEDYHRTTEGTLIPADKAPKFMQLLGKKASLDAERARIKNHQANSPDFYVPGASNNFHGRGKLSMSAAQQSTIRMFENDDPLTDHKVFGNIGVGTGKTMLFGAAHARLMEKLKSEGKPSHGVYIMPAALMDQTYAELKEGFPDMDIQSAGGVDKKKRGAMYKKKHDLLLVSGDTLREDSKTMAEVFENPEFKPAALYGDEVHALFSPNESTKDEDQSMRARALSALHADNMLVMTGTPFRQSLGEAWKVLNWLHPGAVGGMTSFLRTYGSIGQGTTAYAHSQAEGLRQAIDPYTITEEETPPVAHNMHPVTVQPTPEQMERIRQIDETYLAQKKGTHMEKNKSGKTLQGRRMAQVQEVMGGGTAESNPMLKQTKEIIDHHSGNGERGIIHCLSYRAVRSAAALYPKGQILTMTGETSMRDRERIKQAMNTGLPVEGAAVSVGSRKGIVETVDRDLGGQKASALNIGVPKAARIKFDDGSSQLVPVEDIHSEVRAVAGTAVTATGLNLQGTTFNIELEPADSAATQKQRTRRNFRRGQTKDVNSYQLTSDMPSGRKKRRQLETQAKAMKAIDDPSAYNQPLYRDNLLAQMNDHELETTQDEAA